MRRLNPFLALFVAAAMLTVACADPPVSPSDATAPPALHMLENDWQPFTWYWWACDEPVTVEGKVHFTWSLEENDNRWHWRSHSNWIGSGVGEFSGRTYRLSESYNATENVTAGWTYPLTMSYSDQLKLVGQGSATDLRGTWQWHVTVNANGETTATVDRWQFACGHGPPPLEGKLIVNVTDDEDDGTCNARHCSLREALIASNSFSGTDTIAFRIPGRGPHTIQPLSGLPEAFDPVVIDGTTEPNFRGTPIVELDGSQAGEVNGLMIFGGGSTVRGLVINRFGSSVGSANGIDLTWSSGNVIEGNYIGTDVSGTVALGNSNAGVVIGGPDNRIGGTTPEARNVISGNLEGVTIADPWATGNLVQGNYIGTDATGTAAVGNSLGILLLGGDNIVGGSEDGARNLISGNEGGINIHATGNVVQGNYFGTDLTGTAALANTSTSVFLDAPENTIGGTTSGAGNVISGHGWVGVHIAGPDGARNAVVGNYIGTDVSGSAALGHVFAGVLINGPENMIGGTEPGAGNVISGNEGPGVQLSGPDATGNRVYGNLIGTDVTGTVVVGNGGRAVVISDEASWNYVGSSREGARNVLSGNSGGVDISGAHFNRVFANHIGTDITGTQPLGNQYSGVVMRFGSSGNWIGGTREGSGNIVTHSGQAGIRGAAIRLLPNAGTGNAIRGNSVYANPTLGIDIGPGGVTPNDPGDWDTGPNNLQNFPVLFWAGGPSLEIEGMLNSTPDTEFRIEFFANTECNTVPAPYGEGEIYLGAETVVTEPSGDVIFLVTLDRTVPPGTFITATATDPEYNTSEFSACVPTM